MANKTKIVNRIKFITAEDNYQNLEKAVNRFLEECSGNFTNRPETSIMPPEQNGNHLMALIQYSVAVPVEENK